MLKKNIFNIALSCSLVWHLLGGQAVTIVWPAKLMPQQFTSVNFWGSILESVDYSSLHEDSDNTFVRGEQSKPKLKPKEEKDKFSSMQKTSIPLSRLSEKKTPKVKVDVPKADKFLLFEEVTGELKRSVLLKPKLPEYPDWAKELETDFEIELKFLVLPDGTIGTVEKITSSGYPELDEIGVRYIRKWKFMSLPADKPQLEQWGSIKLIFKLK